MTNQACFMVEKYYFEPRCGLLNAEIKIGSKKSKRTTLVNLSTDEYSARFAATVTITAVWICLFKHGLRSV